MKGRPPFVPCLGAWRKGAALLLAGAAAASEPRVAPQTFARAYAPGEIVRIQVAAPAGTREVHGTFGTAPIAFVAKDATTWIGWAVIPLDAPPGALEYRVEAAGGAVDRTLTVEAKAFPEQRLTVESKFVNPPKAVQARIDREKRALDAVYARRTALPPPGTPFVRPVPGEPTSEFGTKRFFNGEARAPHPGIDLRAGTGTPVEAAGPGKVALARDLYYSGGTVVIDHGGGLFTIYGHLSKILVKPGATIGAGDRVGLSGATGRVTGPHLHWGARVGGAIFDPRALLDPTLFGGISPSPTAPAANAGGL